MTFILLWLACGVISAMVASSKGRNSGGWFLIGILLGPIGLLGAVGVGNRTEERKTYSGLQSGKLRKCPVCAEAIQREARKCRFCASDVEPLPTQRGILG